MKKRIGTIFIFFLLLAAPVTAQFYRYTDQNGNLRFTDDLNKVPAEQRESIREYRGSATGSATFSRESGTEIEASQRAGAQPNENQVFGSLATAPAATVSLKELRTQIEKMKEQAEAEYLALVNEKEILAKQWNSRMTQEDLAAYNNSVDEFNQRAINYERMSSALSEMADEFNAIVLEKNIKYQRP
jgi:hypothetical protein